MLKKVLFLCFFVLTFSFLFYVGCNNNTLSDNIIELKSNIYCGTYLNKTVKCNFGFVKKDNVKKYQLTFILPSEIENATNVEISLLNSDYKANFCYSNVAKIYRAEIPVNSVDDKTFTALFFLGENKEEVIFTSVVPDYTIDYNKVLTFLVKNQPTLIENYKQNDVFCGEIILRIMVKNEKPFWYVGLKKDDNLKALLIDGKTGDVLAVRDIF